MNSDLQQDKVFCLNTVKANQKICSIKDEIGHPFRNDTTYSDFKNIQWNSKKNISKSPSKRYLVTHKSFQPEDHLVLVDGKKVITVHFKQMTKYYIMVAYITEEMHTLGQYGFDLLLQCTTIRIIYTSLALFTFMTMKIKAKNKFVPVQSKMSELNETK